MTDIKEFEMELVELINKFSKSLTYQQISHHGISLLIDMTFSCCSSIGKASELIEFSISEGMDRAKENKRRKLQGVI